MMRLPGMIRVRQIFDGSVVEDIGAEISSQIAKVQAVRAQPRRDLSRDALIEKIKETFARLPSVVTEQLAMEWRGFQECSEEDLASTLEELEIIEKLSQTELGD